MKPTLTPPIKKIVSKKIKPIQPKTAVKKNTAKKLIDLKDKPKSLAIYKEKKSFTVVAIGASAGGLEAVTHFLQNLSPTTGMAYIYVQHLSPDHKSILTELLSTKTKMKVQDVENMDKMEPNHVYIIPYNKGIEVTDGHIKLLPRPKTFSLSIDVLFSSLAETHHENVIDIVLSGSASDGTEGLKSIKAAGGLTFAQDDSAKFNSMPKSAIAAGVVDFVLSPKEIALKMNWISKHPFIKLKPVKVLPEDEIDNNDVDLKLLIQLLHKNKNVDFSHYKMNTIKRRIIRRMLIHKINSIKKYAEYCEKKQVELNLLYQDLLINVTEFFRDTEAFVHLKKTILPKLLKNKKQGETLRIWVAACATGEEVYSFAMLLFELLDNKLLNIPFQIFASDLSVDAINEARNGEYSLTQLKNVSPKRVQRFFTKVKDKYRISKSLRDVCVFAEHNILRDPPFSRMDFISCRNLLIYLDTPAQKKAIATFHYALNENGYLMLGKSETIGASLQLFSTPLNKKNKIYTRKKNSGIQRIPEIQPRLLQKTLLEKNAVISNNYKKSTYVNGSNLGANFDSFLLSKYIPASVVINHDLEILQFRGQTSLYLQNATGKASLNILKMASIEITFELRNTIHQAIKTKQTVRKSGIEMNRDNAVNSIRIVNLEVSHLKIDGEEDLLVIVFESHEQQDTIENFKEVGKSNQLAKDRRIKKLEEEIAASRYDMASITLDQEAANEELQSANEEIVSSNEELQSLNEELETSKEEIESTNEELITTNHELQARMLQLEELYSYYQALLDTVHEPVLILDRNIFIKTANKSFCKMFQVTEEECMGVSLYKLGNNQWNILKLRELLEEIVPNNIQFHDFEVEHTFPKIGKKTMLLNAHKIIQKFHKEELIVLTLIDITEVKRLAIDIQVKENTALAFRIETKKKATQIIEESEKKYRNLIQSLPVAVYTCDKDGFIQLYNKAATETWGRAPKIGKDKRFDFFKTFDTKGLLLPIPECPMSIALKEEREVVGVEIIIERPGGSRLYVLPNPRPIYNEEGNFIGVINTMIGLTAQKIIENELLEAKETAEHKTQIAEGALKSKQQFLSNMSHEIRTPMNGIIGFTNVVLKSKLDQTQREYIKAIKSSGDALLVLINDILDLAKVDSGKMTFEESPFNLSDSINTMLQLFETKIKEKNIGFEYDCDKSIPKILLGDSLRLRQILLNLMSNAVKFTLNGKINLSVKKVKDNKENLLIEFKISDTGIGIPNNRLEHIFNDFEQASREISSSYGGTGLGLAIVKQLVEKQGGNIQVISELNKGSVFSFVLNFNKTKKNLLAKQKRMEKIEIDLDKKKIKVLVAEDVALNQLLIKIILEELGFELDIAANGKIAIEKLQHGAYDIVLMDLQMPEMNGFEATAFIRNQIKIEIPIIALTADVTTIDLEKCNAAGMNDYISKPIDEKLLYKKMMKYLKPFE